MPYKHKADELANKSRYNAQPRVKKARAQNTKARRMMTRKGLVRKGDGKDVAHIKPLRRGGKSTTRNLKVSSRKQRAWNRK